MPLCHWICVMHLYVFVFVVVQLQDLPATNLTLTNIYRTFLSEDNIKNTPTNIEENKKHKLGPYDDDDDESFDIRMLTLPEHEHVQCHYVQTFNADIVKQLAIMVSQVNQFSQLQQKLQHKEQGYMCVHYLPHM